MRRDKSNSNTIPYNLASQIRGLYGRVASRLKVDPSYVSRVARGERRSSEIEASLESELRRIMSLVKSNHNGVGRNGAGRNEAGHNTAIKSKKKARVKKKV